MSLYLSTAFAALALTTAASAHDIYSTLRMKDGALPCCGGEDAGASRDCWRTVYRERGGAFQFRMNDGDWVSVPSDRIQFTPIPGDVQTGESHEAHLCYRDDDETVGNYQRDKDSDRLMKTAGGKWMVFFCGLIPPTGF